MLLFVHFRVLIQIWYHLLYGVIIPVIITWSVNCRCMYLNVVPDLLKVDTFIMQCGNKASVSWLEQSSVFCVIV